MPDFLLPSCLMTHSFCNIDKSRSRVRFDIDKIDAICSTMTAGFSLINDKIRFCRLLISITWRYSFFKPPLLRFNPPFNPPIVSSTFLLIPKSQYVTSFANPPFIPPFTPPLSSLPARFLQLHGCRPHRYILCRPARWRNHKSI